MADSDTTPPTPARRLGRRGLILVIALVVVIALIVVFLVTSIGRGNDPVAAPTSSVAVPAESGPPSATAAPVATSTPLPSSASAAPVVTGTSASPAPLDAAAKVIPGVAVSIRSLTAVSGKANGVGEIDGPAIRFDVDFVNSTGAAVDLQTTVISVTSGSDQTPANELVSARAPLPSKVEAHSSTKGTFTFTLPKADRKNVTITVDYRAGTPVVVFHGSAPTS